MVKVIEDTPASARAWLRLRLADPMDIVITLYALITRPYLALIPDPSGSAVEADPAVI